LKVIVQVFMMLVFPHQNVPSGVSFKLET